MRQRVKTLYNVLVLDCPWKHGDGLGRRGAASKYECMDLEEIKAFDLPPHSQNCVLFQWRVAGLVEEAYEVARAWGFNPTKGEMVWRKMTPTGKEHFGMGYIVRWAHESCIIATKGKPQVLQHSTRSLFSAPVPRDENGEIIHSAKPDEFFEIVKSMYAGPRASVFERKARPGFDCYGDEMRYENDSRLLPGADTRSDRISSPEGSDVPSRRKRRIVDAGVVAG